MHTLNLGILAHVDAGKTSLTERLLLEAGAIAHLGSVDRGDTHTDTLALERERGITIQSAVVSFRIPAHGDDDVVVNLIDTPGHPDFIAEVERVLDVLDGVVLVVSAVAGVQAQTRVLFRALQRLRLPTLLFVNKIDRGGAREHSLLDELRLRLTPATVPLFTTHARGERDARVEPVNFTSDAEQLGALDVLGATHPALLDAVLAQPGSVHAAAVHEAIRRASRAAQLHPVLFGSAVTGAGVPALLDSLPALLPARAPAVDAELDGTVFRIERDRGGARVACVALRGGTISVRTSIPVAGELRRVTAIEVFEQGNCVAIDHLQAGRIGRLHGLGDVRIGDAVGSASGRRLQSHFARPTLQTVVLAEDPADGRRLHAALAQLAEQDPLIALRRDDARDETTLSLYGEVQKEVIAETVLREHGITMRFDASTMLYVERPRTTASARRGPPFPFIALVALRIAPAAAGSGVTLVPEIDYGVLPAAFHLAVESAIRDTLQQGLAGWPVIDCTVYITEAIRFRDWATSTPAAHRLLAPLVVMEALRAAGTEVCEPVHRLVVHAPASTATAVLALLARLGAALEPPTVRGLEVVIGGELPADRIVLLQRDLPALTHGEGVVESAFARYRPVRGTQPHRPRIGPDPRDRKTWLMQLGRR